jgi:hypothetical protein
MTAEPFFSAVAWPMVVGLGVSFAIEAAVVPRPEPVWKRPFGTVLIHVGLWSSFFTLGLSIVGRPWCAMAAMSAFLLLLMLINQAKCQSLREPFVFQDFEYFVDALRHPRLYLPFLGWGKSILAGAAIITAAYTGWRVEASLRDDMGWVGFLVDVGGVGILSAGLLKAGAMSQALPTFNCATDIRQLGWLASLWNYGAAEAKMSAVYRSPALRASRRNIGTRPAIVAVQSESFFDPRRVFRGIRPEVLEQFDIMKGEAWQSGPLEVPAWGANTVRTEFAFLTGLGESQLGVHKFNPYRRLSVPTPTLASLLKEDGYRTICIHPYPASFYKRDKIYPLLGFDEFIDIDQFDGAQRSGPFISDLAVAEKMAAILKDTPKQPIFLFIITMENHGPLHLERVSHADVDRYYCMPPPEGCEDLTIYLRHLANADKMAGHVRKSLNSLPGDAWFVWFGDHVPIMPTVYRRLCEPDGRTEYVIWRKGGMPSAVNDKPLRVEDLASVLLHGEQTWVSG